MRTTVNLSADALVIAKQLAMHNGVSLSDAVTQLIRAGANAISVSPGNGMPLLGRFALLPRRNEVITPKHIRKLINQNGI